ncbi:MAG TPA: hypothetical protein VHB77_01775, partial [Planctomycetaceae bacterium]|nr:hypothetical protein [Planctomycetaceae bacterium]
MVLLHYTRLRPGQANRLIESLHRGGREEHLLAARLLARHATAQPHVVDEFLRTVRGWALTTQYLAGEILAQASRAAHHQSLTPWLYDLLHDEALPWHSRIEAAAALATRLRRDHSDDALRVLRAGIEATEAPIEARLNAAAALAECDPGSRMLAEKGLRAVLEKSSTSGSNSRTAAAILATFDGAARDAAVRALKRLAMDGYRTNEDRVEAATGLIEIGAEFFAYAGEVFRAVLRDQVHSAVGRRDAAIGLASLGQQERFEAATELTKFAHHVGMDRLDRLTAAIALSELGPEHRETAGQLALDITREPGARRHERWMGATRLAQLGGGIRQEAAAILRSVFTDPEATPNDLVWAAGSLADLGPEFTEEAAQRLHRLLADPFVVSHDRVNALGSLAVSGEPHRAQALEQLRADMTAPETDNWTKTLAADRLVTAGPEFHPEVVDLLLHLATTQNEPEVVARAWNSLVDLRPEYRDEAIAGLFDVLRSPNLDASALASARMTLKKIDTAHVQLKEALFNIFQNASVPPMARMHAARDLIDLEPAFLPDVMSRLFALVPTEDVGDFDLGRALGGFMTMGIGVRRELGRVLRDVVCSPDAPSSWISHAVQTLDQLGLPIGPAEIQALTAAVGDETAPRYERDTAAAFLAGMHRGLV